MTIYYLLLYFFVYGILGWGTEVAYATTKEHRFVNRGFLNGPICPIYGVGVSAVVFLLTPYSNRLLFLYVASVVLVTLIEGITGFAMDKIFHHKWWDYSNVPLNIGGYVCLLFSLVWGVACVLIVKLIHPVIHHILSWIPTVLGVVILVVLCIVLFADLYVTASSILKLNKRLESMEKIAAELRELSDKMGESIHENVMETSEKLENAAEKFEDATERFEGATEKFEGAAEKLSNVAERFQDAAEEQKKRVMDAAGGQKKRMMDAAEEQKKRMMDAAEEQKRRMQELRERYSELATAGSKTSARLMKAFPKMESRKHNEILIELRRAIEERRNKNS